MTSGTAFRFRLERVRAVRERKEKLAQQELAKAMSRRSSTAAELRHAEDLLAHAHLELRGAAAESGTTSAADLLARQAFLERVEAQRGLRAHELEGCEAAVADRDAELTTAAAEHDRDAERRERNQLDEIAAARHGRSAA